MPVPSRVSLRFLPLVAIPFLVWLVSYHSLMREQQALVHLRAMWVSPNSKPLSGAKWEASLHSAIGPACPAGKTVTTRYSRAGMPTIALASFPRSGNSYTRSLIERASGYQTASLHCDPKLEKTFASECAGFDNPWLVKTHFPSGRDRVKTGRWDRFDKAVQLVRNPLDQAWSQYNIDQTKTHIGRVQGLEKFGPQHYRDLQFYAKRWVQHAKYWHSAQIQVHTVRYEDLRRNTLTSLVSLLTFLLPLEDLPPLEKVACALELDADKDPYESRKSSVFHAWDKYDDEARAMFFDIVKEPWCRFGYDQLLKEIRGDVPIDCRHISKQMYRQTSELDLVGDVGNSTGSGVDTTGE